MNGFHQQGFGFDQQQRGFQQQAFGVNGAGMHGLGINGMGVQDDFNRQVQQLERQWEKQRHDEERKRIEEKQQVAELFLLVMGCVDSWLRKKEGGAKMIE